MSYSPFKPNPLYKGKWYASMIDNPAYKGEWAPRKIPNPAFFEDLTPVKSLKPIGGVGIELWTMTEDILFDNIYVGHSLEDAQALAAETWEVKKKLEDEAKKAAVVDDEETEETVVSFKEDPVAFLRQKVLTFVDIAKADPLLAIQSQPETGVALSLVLFSFIGMLGVLMGLVGGQQKPVTKVRYPSFAEVNNNSDSYTFSLPRRPMHLQRTTRPPRLRPKQSPLRLQVVRRPILPPRSASRPIIIVDFSESKGNGAPIYHGH